jgi:hypothetical protein
MVNLKKMDWNAYKSLAVRIILIVLTPFLIYFWGLAIIGNITAFWGIFTPVNSNTFSKDLAQETPVLPPTISTLPKAVKEPKFTVSGYTQEGMQVKIFLNGDQVALVRSDKNGQFSFDGIILTEGNNEILTKAIDKNRVESGPSKKVTVKYLKKPPLLELTNLGDNADIRQNINVFPVTGKTEPGVNVTINGSLVFVDNNGSFTYPLALPDGASTVTAAATDEAGNQATITRNVTFTKQ